MSHELNDPPPRGGVPHTGRFVAGFSRCDNEGSGRVERGGLPNILNDPSVAEIRYDTTQSVERLSKLRSCHVARIARPGGERELRCINPTLVRLNIGQCSQ